MTFSDTSSPNVRLVDFNEDFLFESSLMLHILVLRIFFHSFPILFILKNFRYTCLCKHSAEPGYTLYLMRQL